MADNTRVAARYAKSIFDLAEEHGQLEALNADMALLEKTARDNHAFDQLLRSPVVNTDKKLTILKQLFAGKVSALMISVFEIMARKHREDQLTAVARAFHRLYNRKQGIAEAVVTTPTPLTPALRQEFIAKVKQMTGQAAELKEEVNPDLLGGYMLQVGDRRIDDSVRTRLRELRRTLTDDSYVASV
ncbi:MAG: ATP synthase F1 subunit delta [Catalinimonas sp.]